MKRVDLAETLAAAWNQHGLRYVVVHGLDRYPDEVGRDLDILVHADDSDLMTWITVAAIEGQGWRAVEPPAIWGHRVVAFSGALGLELHPVTQLSWREVRFVDKPLASQFVGAFPVDPWASYVKQILMPGFHGDGRKVIENDASLELTDAQRTWIGQRLQGLMLKGDHGLATSIAARRGEDLVKALPGLRAALVKRAWRTSPISSAAAIYRKILERGAAITHSSGTTMRIIAAEGTSASEIKRSLEAADRTIFTGIVCREFPVKNDSRTSRIFQYVRSAWSTVATDRFALRGQTVVFHIWTGMRHRRHVRSVAGLAPRPDGVVVMQAIEDPELSARVVQLTPSAATSYADQIMAAAVEGFIRRHHRR